MSGISSLYQPGPFTISEFALILHRKRNALSMALAGNPKAGITGQLLLFRMQDEMIRLGQFST